MINKITEKDFDNIINHNKSILIDFYADWCGPCRALGPVLEEISNEKHNFNIGKVNVDEEKELASRFKIRSIPTMIVFENGNEVERVVGFIPKEEIILKMKKNSR